jgi:rare lipoprotein A
VKSAAPATPVRVWTVGALALLAACSGPAPRRAPTSPVTVPGTKPPVDVSQVPDAVPRAEPRSEHGNPPFYDVLGQRYVLLPSAANYVERGVASWYGPTFHGKATSSGEPYDMYGMTAAHKTLPIPCYARVTNLSNGRSVIVRINDRGPFVANRLIDLSYTAAARLDMIRGGTAFVEVQTLLPGAPLTVTTTPPATAAMTPAATPVEPIGVATGAEALPTPGAASPVFGPARVLTVQVGAYGSESNAQRVAERLKAAGIGNVYVSRGGDQPGALQRVRIGPLSSVAEFDRLQSRLGALGLTGSRLVTDP